MIVTELDVKWVVDPGPFHEYKIEKILDFLKWIEEWEYPAFPSARYFILKERIHFWNAHQFRFGLSCKKHAEEFNKVYPCVTNSPGIIKNGRFVLLT